MKVRAYVLYARFTGWIYLLLAITGIFERHLFYVFTLPVLTVLIYLMIGLSGLTIAQKVQGTGLMVYNLLLGIALLFWGLIGTLQPDLFTPAPLPLDNALHLLTGLWAFYGLLSRLWTYFSAKSKKEDAN